LRISSFYLSPEFSLGTQHLDHDSLIIRMLLHHLWRAAELRAPTERAEGRAEGGQPGPDVRLHLQGRQWCQEGFRNPSCRQCCWLV
jgi:hypothetical protein